jgi:hypothetical protein
MPAATPRMPESRTREPRPMPVTISPPTATSAREISRRAAGTG